MKFCKLRLTIDLASNYLAFHSEFDLDMMALPLTNILRLKLNCNLNKVNNQLANYFRNKPNKEMKASKISRVLYLQPKIKLNTSYPTDEMQKQCMIYQPSIMKREISNS